MPWRGVPVGDPPRARRRPARARASGWPGEYSIAADGRRTSARAARRGSARAGRPRRPLARRARRAARGRGAPDRVRRLVLEDVGMPHPRRPAPPARPEGELGLRLAGRRAGAPARSTTPTRRGPRWRGRWRRRRSWSRAGRAASSPAEHVAELVAALPRRPLGHPRHRPRGARGRPGRLHPRVARLPRCLPDFYFVGVGVSSRASGCGRPAPAPCARRCRSPRRRAG